MVFKSFIEPMLERLQIKTGKEFKKDKYSYKLLLSHINKGKSLNIFQVIPNRQRIEDLVKYYNSKTRGRKADFKPIYDVADNSCIGYEIFPK